MELRTCFDCQISDRKLIIFICHYNVFCVSSLCRCPLCHRYVVSLHVVCIYLLLTSCLLLFFFVFFLLRRFVLSLTSLLSNSHIQPWFCHRPVRGHASPILCYIRVLPCPIRSLCGYPPRQCSGTCIGFQTTRLDLTDLTYPPSYWPRPPDFFKLACDILL